MQRRSKCSTSRPRCSISTTSRRAASSFRVSASNGRFKIVSSIAKNPDEVRAAIERVGGDGGDRHSGRFRGGVAQRLKPPPPRSSSTGRNSNTALIALGYVEGEIVSTYAQEVGQDLRGAFTRASRPRRRSRSSRAPWYNPDYNSRWFFVPGVIATLTLVMVVNLTSFAVVREREVGTLEQIMVTPIRPLEFILGKTIPFFCVGLALTALVAGAGTLSFQIPFVGNPFVLLLGTSLYLLSVLGIGLLISTVCSTQQQAFATNFFVINPLFTLSGFSFPISSMPAFMQWLSIINPMTYYLVVIRGTFLKGVGLAVLWPQMLALAALGVALLAMSVLRFRKSLD